jgi:RHS repeat-associated protein
MNLPKAIATAGVGTIATVYDAMGRKVCQEAYSPQNVVQKRVDYQGDFIYQNGILNYIQHEAGRIMPDGGPNEWEYQYHLRDHLGNVRLTFTSKESSNQSAATLEDSNATTEQSQFLYYSEAVRVNSQFFDHTNQGGTYYSTRLNGTVNEKFGLAKSLSVMPGDVINVDVFAKYLDPVQGNWGTTLANLMNSIAQGTAPAGTFIDGGLAGSAGGATVPYTTLLNRSGETGVAPKAYLNWLLFDSEFGFIDGGYLRVDETAKESGNDGPHQKLSRQIQVTQAGYVYVYLSNENETPVEVYFDDLTVEHIKSPVVQINEYYPFGLSAGSWTREDAVPNAFLFNKGSELNASVGWYETYFRGYDPSIGRFMQIDPLADQFASYTPYNFAYNDPVFWNDPLGAINTSDWTNPGFPAPVWDMIIAMAESTPKDHDGFFSLSGGGGDESYPHFGSFYNVGGDPIYINGVAGTRYTFPIEGTALAGFGPGVTSDEFRNLLDGILIATEGALLHEERIAQRFLKTSASKGHRHMYKTSLKTMKSLGRLAGFGAVGVSWWEASEKGTTGAYSLATLDTVVAVATIAFPILAPFALIYGGVRLGLDLAGVDVAGAIDKKIK